MTETVALTNPDGARIEFGTAADVERREVLRVTKAIIFLAQKVRGDDRSIAPRIVYTGKDPWPWTALIGAGERRFRSRDGASTRYSIGATGRTPSHALACLLDAVRRDHQRIQLRDAELDDDDDVYTSGAGP